MRERMSLMQVLCSRGAAVRALFVSSYEHRRHAPRNVRARAQQMIRPRQVRKISTGRKQPASVVAVPFILYLVRFCSSKSYHINPKLFVRPSVRP